MGKGDKKTKRGKLFQGSYGVKRSKKTQQTSVRAITSSEKPKDVEIKPVKEVKEPVKEVKAPPKETKPVKETNSKTTKTIAAKKESKSK